MIIYHHRNDIYHCVFRLLSIFIFLEKKIEIERIKIIDFYFTFPHLLANAAIPRTKGSLRLKKEAQTFNIPYENLPSNKILFSEMGDFQSQAIDILLAKDILRINRAGFLIEGESFKNAEIINITDKNYFTSNSFFKVLVDIFSNAQLYGTSGLKCKTGLMEYRYDAI